jgi:aldehyde:ferredoxin oxidoreductase
MGWVGKVLRVNLTQGRCTAEDLNWEWAAKYLGARGLGSKYLASEIDPRVEPLSAANKLIFATGPLTGTMAATGARYSVICKGALTGTIACSNAGGFFGAELKRAGWDLVIFDGMAAQPVYLLIENDRATVHSAASLSGRSCRETEQILRQRHDPRLRVAAIGRAGEHLVRYSGVVGDGIRVAGRSGAGAVMAAKNLKAVAVRGAGEVAVRDAGAFAEAADRGRHLLGIHPVTGQALPADGTLVLMNLLNEAGALPTRNHQAVQFEGAYGISSEGLAQPSGQGCFNCPITCTRAPAPPGSSRGPEYVSAGALGAATGVGDPAVLMSINQLCDDHGMDTVSFGATVAAAMELYELGAVTERHTGGLELRFGSAEALLALAEQTVNGNGFGVEIGQGSRWLCERYGHPELSMSVKGLELPAYDPRALQGMGLAFATSNRGACHLRGNTVNSEMLGLPDKTDPRSTVGKAELVKRQQDVAAAFDAAGICLFTSYAWGLGDLAAQVDAACPGGWTAERLLEIGERIWTLERQFNLAAGISSRDDTLPRRLLDEPIESGPAKGQVNRLGEMLPEYYRLRGWTAAGVPTNETLSRLAL